MIVSNGVSENKAVLITGCSSGIGRAAALTLARNGFTVFATVRRESDAEDLRGIGEPGLVPVCPLDLTRPDQITDARRTVESELASRGINGLYAVVNNAGGGSIAPIELMDVDKFRTELETRLVGSVALLQAFLPLIRQAHGRIIWIVTPAIVPIANISMIHSCDFAANCLARTLNQELKPWGIPSVMVRCGGIDTASPRKSEEELEESLQRLSKEKVDLYREALRKEKNFHSRFDGKRTPVEAVGTLVCKVLVKRRPKSRYRIGYMSGISAFLEALPQPLVDRLLASR